MDARQQQYLDVMGITVWQHKDTAQESNGEAISSLDWLALEERVEACQLCDLHQRRSQTVFGAGDRQAELMIVGEAPGTEEDHIGEPFVGQAGQLLNAMLQAIGIQRQQVYIANMLKCRPAEDHHPSVDQANKCQDYLFRQIDLVQPKLILVLGRFAAQRLLNTKDALESLRKQLHAEPRSGIPMLVTYHPAYLLRSPKKKREAWQDLIAVKKTLQDMVVG